jgi:hypothetical protein
LESGDGARGGLEYRFRRGCSRTQDKKNKDNAQAVVISEEERCNDIRGIILEIWEQSSSGRQNDERKETRRGQGVVVLKTTLQKQS